MSASQPLVCYQCWPLTRTHFGPCEHALALRDAARAEEGNPKPCVECDGVDCERCGGTGFYCHACPTFGRAADMWQALLESARAEANAARAEQREALAFAAECVEEFTKTEEIHNAPDDSLWASVGLKRITWGEMRKLRAALRSGR